MTRAFIGVGSNEGDRLRLISDAARRLGAVPGVQLVQMATIIETEPVGGPPQGPYLNTVIEIETARTPQDLLSELQAIEKALGRTPSGERWGPRPIDLDLLLYGDQVIDQPTLRVPHPRLHERRFVLEPLAQLAPDAIHPALKRAIHDLLAAVPAEAPSA